ncbi:MAG: hypothetical protein KKD94_01595 [Nanoarchaeota archaeon]|nr:hypothetical protein [Nanoarchaeota archaeon]
MRKKFIVLSLVLVVSLLISLACIVIINKNTSTSPPTTEILEVCKSVVNNGPGINVLFFSDENTAQKYSDYFLSIAPFNNHKEKFNFFYIDKDAYEVQCELYRGFALYCYSKELIKKAASCPYDYIAVLEEQPRSIRSSAFKGVMSLNLKHPLSVLAHEFGHVFDNFAEEYPAENARIPRGAENCQKNCEFNKFPGEFDCHQGCTKESYDREFEKGFMRDLGATRYGPYDELLLEEETMEQYEEKSQNTITGSAIAEIEIACSQQEYILIEGIYEKNNIEITSKELLPGCAPRGKRDGSLYYTVLNENQEVLDTNSFYPEQIFITDFTESGEISSPPEENTQENFIITTPATGQEETLEISDETGEVIEEINLQDAGARPCKI